MQPKIIRWRMTIIMGIGVILVVLGAGLAIRWDNIFRSILENELKLSPNSKSYDVWKEPPIELFFDFYFFNWTNPDDIENKTIKPNFVEMGPYRFRETKKKVNITWHPENDTVSYQQMRHWYFDEESSNGSLSDNITTLNVVAASAVYSTRFWSYVKQKGLSMGLSMFRQTVSVTKTVGELLFDGYEDPLLDLAKSLPNIETNAPPVDRFGWFYERNGSLANDGYFNVATGQKNMSIFGEALRWNNVSQTKFYPGTCGNVNGSAGEFYPMQLTKNQKISLFSPDLCRTIAFDFEKEDIVNGIPAYKYSGGSSMLDNGTIHPENKCFCVGDCQPSGALNVSSCRYGSPAFVSLPHFHMADPYYRNEVDGMEPDADKHSFYMTLEPTSGIPVDVAARFQLNILIAPSNNVGLYKKMPRKFLPILWFQQQVTISGKLADDVKLMLKVPLIGNIISLSIFILGILIILWTPIRDNIAACRRSRGSKKERRENINRNIILNNTKLSRENLYTTPHRQSRDVMTTSDEESVREPLNTITNDFKCD